MVECAAHNRVGAGSIPASATNLADVPSPLLGNKKTRAVTCQRGVLWLSRLPCRAEVTPMFEHC